VAINDETALPPIVRVAAVAATGPVIPRPGTLYLVRLAVNATGANQVIVRLRDHTTDVADLSRVFLVLLAGDTTGSDHWPGVPLRLRLERGLTAEFLGTGAALLSAFWDPK
jgi:hypothetical protein